MAAGIIPAVKNSGRFGVIPAKERVKKSANRLNPGRSVVPAKAGTHAKVLFQRLKWIPAFAGMTLRSLAEVCNFDFFTRSKAGIHVQTKHYLAERWVPAFAGTTQERSIIPAAGIT